MTLGHVIIKANRDKPIRQRHPWIFSGAIERIDSSVADGDMADVLTLQGEFLARGYVNRKSQIVVRLLTWNAAEVIDAEFWARRLSRSINLRADSTARRLIN